MRLSELFDTKPEKFKNNTSGRKDVKAYSFDVDGTDYVVAFEKISSDKWKFFYNYDRSSNKFTPDRKSGDAVTVLSYVVSYTERFLKSEKPTYLKFVGENDVGLGKIYSMMGKVLNKRLRNLGYIITAEERSASTEFMICKIGAKIPFGFEEIGTKK